MEKCYDVIIIGSGPAGLSAAIYGQRAQLKMLIIEKEAFSGGQILTTYEVDNYPGIPGVNGFDLGVKLREHADNLGAEFVADEVLECQLQDDIKKIICKDQTYKTKTVIIATGAHHRTLGVPGEEEFKGRGVSYCATCDGAFFKNKTTVVVGGGDVALEDAIFLARMCEKVYVIHRRDQFRGAKSLQKKLLSYDNVEIIWNHVVTRIDGGDKVEGIDIEDVNSHEVKELAVDGVFMAVGITPSSGIFDQIEMTEHGYIVADEDAVTSIKGVFAAGDVRTKALRQIVTAVSDGANAITSVEKYLAEN